MNKGICNSVLFLDFSDRDNYHNKSDDGSGNLYQAKSGFPAYTDHIGQQRKEQDYNACNE